jgi:hypothetical protein
MGSRDLHILRVGIVALDDELSNDRRQIVVELAPLRRPLSVPLGWFIDTPKAADGQNETDLSSDTELRYHPPR